MGQVEVKTRSPKVEVIENPAALVSQGTIAIEPALCPPVMRGTG